MTHGSEDCSMLSPIDPPSMPCGAGSQSRTIPYFLSRRNQGDPRVAFWPIIFWDDAPACLRMYQSHVQRPIKDIFRKILKRYKVIPMRNIKSNTLVLGRKFSLLILFVEYYDVANNMLLSFCIFFFSLSQWPTFKLLGITYLVWKIEFELLFHGLKWLGKFCFGCLSGMVSDNSFDRLHSCWHRGTLFDPYSCRPQLPQHLLDRHRPGALVAFVDLLRSVKDTWMHSQHACGRLRCAWNQDVSEEGERPISTHFAMPRQVATCIHGNPIATPPRLLPPPTIKVCSEGCFITHKGEGGSN